MSADEIRFRCSSLGYIMTDGRSKNGELSETCKTHLVDVFVSAKYKRQTDIFTKFTTKGLMVEEDSITLYSRVRKTFFKKNPDRLDNEFISGHPDLYEGESIVTASKIIDIKSSWDIYTFFRSANPDKLNKNYYWQLQGYMALTGAKTSTLAYCLVNTPEVLINDEKRKLLWRMNAGTEENETYKAACEELDKLMIYDDIPLSERLIELTIERNDDDIARIAERVMQCRKYMNQNLFK